MNNKVADWDSYNKKEIMSHSLIFANLHSFPINNYTHLNDRLNMIDIIDMIEEGYEPSTTVCISNNPLFREIPQKLRMYRDKDLIVYRTLKSFFKKET